ncbi:MAG: glycosyltransferase family 39 protein [Planctomycetes bacterium]|nr:glycosyltransferase family 39 protein [Planctomycetota bacterium]
MTCATLRNEWPLFVAVGLGLALRLFRLDEQSLWYDEAYTLVTSRLPMAEIPARLVTDVDTHPPLYYLLLHAWHQVAGFGAWEARLLSALLGACGIAALYVLARRFVDRATAGFAALLMAVSQLGVMYGQEARPYALFHLLALAVAIAFVEAFHEGSGYAWCATVVATILLAYTNYYGAFIVVALLAYAVLRRSECRIPRSWWAGGFAVVLLACLPWLASGIVRRVFYVDPQYFGEQPPWFAFSWTSPLSTLASFGNAKMAGLQAATPAVEATVGLGLFGVAAILGIARLWQSEVPPAAQRSARPGLMLFTCLVVVPMFLAAVVGALGGKYTLRLVSASAGPYYVLAACGLTALSSPPVRWTWTTVVLVFSAAALRANYFIPYKENYRDALAFLAEEYRAGDCVLFHPFGKVPLEWQIYQADRPEPRVLDPATAPGPQADCGRVWLVAYQRTPRTTRAAQEVKAAWAGHYPEFEDRRFHWVDVTRFEREP